MIFLETVMGKNLQDFQEKSLASILILIEVEEYDEDDDLDDTVKEIHEEVAAQVVDQKWTRTLTATNIPPFSVENPGPTNILDKNQTELNFFELLFTNIFGVFSCERLKCHATKRTEKTGGQTLSCQPVLDVILRQIEVNYVPYQDLSVDEVMTAFRGCLNFRQYLPVKPTKYGVKVWEICDARNGYCFDFDVYLGHPTGPGGAEAREVQLGQ